MGVYPRNTGLKYALFLLGNTVVMVMLHCVAAKVGPGLTFLLEAYFLCAGTLVLAPTMCQHE